MTKQQILTLLQTSKIGNKSIIRVIENTSSGPKGLSELLDLLKETKRENPLIKIPAMQDFEKAHLSPSPVCATLLL